MVDYVKLAATAKRQVEKNGREVDFIKSNRDAANASQPWRGPDLSAEPDATEGGEVITAKAAFLATRGSSLGIDYSDKPEDLLRDVSVFALVAATSLPDGTDLSEFDFVRDGATLRRILFVGELRPGEIGLLWEVALSA